MNSLRDYSTNLCLVGQIIEDIKAVLPTIIKASFTHFRCQVNEIAYRLARYSLIINRDCIWIESPPDLTLDVLIEDAPLP